MRIEVDKVTVERVDVILRLLDGSVFAAGAATCAGRWWFRPSRPIPPGELDAIEVTARDLAGNVTTKVEHVNRP